ISEPPRQHNSEVPPAIDDVAMNALRVTPKDRFRTAAEFADALEQAAGVSGITIASPRAVSAFIRELQIDGSLHPPPDSGGSARPPASQHSPSLAMEFVRTPTLDSSTNVGTLSSSVTDAPIRSRFTLFTTVALLGVVLGAAGFFFVHGKGRLPFMT